jgi:hypothetical protein
MSDLILLPGTEYSAYALPLDYMPSRDFQPRWGGTKSPICSLGNWFNSYATAYHDMLAYMRNLQLGHIAIELSDTIRIPQPAWVGGAICAFDSLALYAMIRKYRPSRYVEIGSGMTTCFARQSVMDAGLPTKIVSIDPMPRAQINSLCDYVVRDGLETVDVSLFDTLEAGDILFFDGSHRSFMNSDVTVFFIDVLPRLKAGVIIHIHDIMLPYDYPDSFKHWYWNEQYMLAVYMMQARERIVPLFPTAFICRDSQFNTSFSTPFSDLGSNEKNMSWRGGGSMWFTHKISYQF